jgi:hypothetical protein
VELLEILETFRVDPSFDQIVIGAQGLSMVPTIVPGDRIHLVRARRPIQIGDLVLAKGLQRFYVHRVVATSPRLRTKGDSAPVLDEEGVEAIAFVERIERTWLSRLRRIRYKFWRPRA